MSEQDRIAFEKWAESPSGSYVNAELAWNTATAEANKRMADLELEVQNWKDFCKKVQKIDFNDYRKLEGEVTNLRLNIKAQEQLGYELQANNHDLREALEDIARVNHSSAKCGEIAKQALSTTPAESLAKRDDVPVCEECNVNMHPFAYDGISGYSCDGCGWSVDDLKGKV